MSEYFFSNQLLPHRQHPLHQPLRNAPVFCNHLRRPRQLLPEGQHLPRCAGDGLRHITGHLVIQPAPFTLHRQQRHFSYIGLHRPELFVGVGVQLEHHPVAGFYLADARWQKKCPATFRGRAFSCACIAALSILFGFLFLPVPACRSVRWPFA